MLWKIISGFEDYMVSDKGSVYSLKRKIEIKQYENKGYFGVYLYKLGERRFMLVHRIVAMAFIANPNNYPQINHIDENRGNNAVENLEWCSAKYNANYGHRREKMRKINHFLLLSYFVIVLFL